MSLTLFSRHYIKDIVIGRMEDNRAQFLSSMSFQLDRETRKYILKIMIQDSMR